MMALNTSLVRIFANSGHASEPILVNRPPFKEAYKMRLLLRTISLVGLLCFAATVTEAKTFQFNRSSATAKEWSLSEMYANATRQKLYAKELPYFGMMQLAPNGKINFFSAITNCSSGTWQMRGNSLSLTLTAKEKFDGLNKATKVTIQFTRNSIGEKESPFHKGKMLQVLTLEGKVNKTSVKYVFTEFEGKGGS